MTSAVKMMRQLCLQAVRCSIPSCQVLKTGFKDCLPRWGLKRLPSDGQSVNVYNTIQALLQNLTDPGQMPWGTSTSCCCHCSKYVTNCCKTDTADCKHCLVRMSRGAAFHAAAFFATWGPMFLPTILAGVIWRTLPAFPGTAPLTTIAPMSGRTFKICTAGWERCENIPCVCELAKLAALPVGTCCRWWHTHVTQGHTWMHLCFLQMVTSKPRCNLQLCQSKIWQLWHNPRKERAVNRQHLYNAWI